jgi:hypothetical protein
MPLIAYGGDACGIKSIEVQGRYGGTVLQNDLGPQGGIRLDASGIKSTNVHDQPDDLTSP